MTINSFKSNQINQSVCLYIYGKENLGVNNLQKILPQKAVKIFVELQGTQFLTFEKLAPEAHQI